MGEFGVEWEDCPNQNSKRNSSASPLALVPQKEVDNASREIWTVLLDTMVVTGTSPVLDHHFSMKMTGSSLPSGQDLISDCL